MEKSFFSPEIFNLLKFEPFYQLGDIRNHACKHKRKSIFLNLSFE